LDSTQASGSDLKGTTSSENHLKAIDLDSTQASISGGHEAVLPMEKIPPQILAGPVVVTVATAAAGASKAKEPEKSEARLKLEYNARKSM